MSIFNYHRRRSSSVPVGVIVIGGDNPIRVQSMTNVSTNDIEACVEQSLRIAAKGGELVRLTTQGVKEATAIGEIRHQLRLRDCDVPIVADVHFNPKAAYVAAENTDKVRINPGNFVDVARTFQKLEFTDEEYQEEIDKIRRALIPFLDLCKAHNTAVRLGVNHGSLSDRIMSRYGDTPAGMVESVMEFLRICREQNFDRIIISIKASNTVVMVQTVRLLCKAMEAEDMHFPLHLGVTEAGDDEEGRIKSAVGIGTLLAEGIGDTIRVSLSEEPEAEIPVARQLVDHIIARQGHAPIIEPQPFDGEARLYSLPIEGFEQVRHPLVIDHDIDQIPADWHICKADSDPSLISDDKPVVVHSDHVNAVGEIQAFIGRMVNLGKRNPVIIRLTYATDNIELLQIQSGADFGTMLLNGYGSAIWLDAPAIDQATRTRICLGILQAARLRVSHTEYISCPGCGRTLFALQDTIKSVKAATSHLKGLKIGIMGCIVNGPGEMADADYGYVGAAAGKVSLYKNKECIEKNIPQEEALQHLIDLIKANGDWQDPL